VAQREVNVPVYIPANFVLIERLKVFRARSVRPNEFVETAKVRDMELSDIDVKNVVSSFRLNIDGLLLAIKTDILLRFATLRGMRAQIWLSDGDYCGSFLAGRT
jgi:hypothetical protein